ncbi:MAG: biotin/lipoyl-binding protein, partial [Burkholderiaceae bacterium]
MNNNFQLKPVALVLIAAFALTIGAIGLLASPSRAAAESKPASPKPALTVTTAQPQQIRLPVKLAANGNIMAWQEASVGAEANGLRLTEVRVNVGDQVRAGQVLATFAPETVQADLAQAGAS